MVILRSGGKLRSLLCLGVLCSLPPISKPDDSVTHDPAKKVSLFAAYFNEKQSDFFFNAPDSCDPQPALTLFAYIFQELLGYMKEMDNSIALDPDGLLPFLFSKCAAILAPKISDIF